MRSTEGQSRGASSYEWLPSGRTDCNELTRVSRQTARGFELPLGTTLKFTVNEARPPVPEMQPYSDGLLS